MLKFRKVWSPDKNRWLLDTKGIPVKEAWAMFQKAFPDTDITETAFRNQRSRVGAAGISHTKGVSRKSRPLYSEQEKKGYIRIKIAQPNVWISKSQWVYMETHPWEDFTEKSHYIFLDGDNRNFHPDNIERLSVKYMALYSSFGGCVKGQPELTRLHIAQAKLKYAQMNRLEELGETVVYGGVRTSKANVNRLARLYREKNYDHLAEIRHKHYREHRDEILRKQREYRNRKKLKGR